MLASNRDGATIRMKARGDVRYACGQLVNDTRWEFWRLDDGRGR
jgi:hypothetical protein